VGDTVISALGVVYYCILAHTAHQPPNATYWSTTPTTEANGDWRFAYREPSDCLFARRIVNPAGQGRAYDPDPPPFRVGVDEAGPLIYTNQEEPELEYTFRPVCASSSGDAIFRSALAWRHAFSLAPPLARDEKKALACWQMYEAIIGQARVKASNEQQQDKAGEADWIQGR
jgi:hypothetical protein